MELVDKYTVWDKKYLLFGSVPKSLINIVEEKWKENRNSKDIEIISECY
jgi:hypothetical protein